MGRHLVFVAFIAKMAALGNTHGKTARATPSRNACRSGPHGICHGCLAQMRKDLERGVPEVH